MKLTRTRLKQIIKEELEAVVENGAAYRKGEARVSHPLIKPWYQNLTTAVDQEKFGVEDYWKLLELVIIDLPGWFQYHPDIRDWKMFSTMVKSQVRHIAGDIKDTSDEEGGRKKKWNASPDTRLSAIKGPEWGLDKSKKGIG